MVDIWLKQNYDIEVFGKPTWRKLVIAVAAKSGGSHRYQATEIAKKYRKYSVAIACRVLLVLPHIGDLKL